MSIEQREHKTRKIEQVAVLFAKIATKDKFQTSGLLFSMSLLLLLLLLSLLLWVTGKCNVGKKWSKRKKIAKVESNAQKSLAGPIQSILKQTQNLEALTICGYTINSFDYSHWNFCGSKPFTYIVNLNMLFVVLLLTFIKFSNVAPVNSEGNLVSISSTCLCEAFTPEIPKAQKAAWVDCVFGAFGICSCKSCK